MSKIAEKQAEELFPFQSIDGGEIEAYFNACQLHKREIYIKCYDQAMQDFMEKACKWWSTIPDDTYGFNPCKIYIEQFRNYMQDGM